MNILFAASECAPFSKSGGLADVAQALPKALAKQPDVNVYVFLPYYGKMKYDPSYSVEFVQSFTVRLAWRTCYAGIFRLKSRAKKLHYYFIDNEYYFNRDTPYGYLDDGERYAFFSKAVLEATAVLGLDCRLIHCNDWQTALIPVLIKADPARFGHMRTVFTIHNIEYQGIADRSFVSEVLGLDDRFTHLLDLDGATNFMKGALIAADKITTVSETYAREILDPYYAHGLEKILAENRYKLVGITNGIDTDVYNPATDAQLAAPFSADDPAGKAACKRALQEELGLDVRDNVPLVAIVSRLVSHKGMELIECVLREIAATDLQLVVLGTGEGRFEGMFQTLAHLYPHKISVSIRFSTEMASRIYGAADFLLMPSKSEPCGLSQLIAMRYGALPIVRETGGLADTVPAVNPAEHTGRGFTFKSYNAHDMLDSIYRAVGFYYDDPDGFRAVSENNMRFDSSWGASVVKYREAYGSVSL